MKGLATIEHANVQCSCFVLASWPMRETLKNVKIVALESCKGQKHFLSVSGSTSIPRTSSGESTKNVLKINGKFANALHLKNGEQVSFWDIEDKPVNITTARLSCCSEDDWEILETNSEYVAHNLLNQLRVVYPGQEFPFWLSKSMVIHLKIDEITPNVDYGILVQNTDVIIPSCASFRNTVPYQLSNHQKLRLHPIHIPDSVNFLPTESLLLSNIYHGFTYKSHVKLEHYSHNENGDTVYVKLLLNNENDSSQDSTVLKLFLLDSIDSKTLKKYIPYVSIPSIHVNSELLKAKNLRVGDWMWVVGVPDSQFTHVPVKPSTFVDGSISSNEYKYRLSCFKHLLKECTNFLKASLSLSEQNFQHTCTGPEFGSILIHGPSGSGKSSLAVAVAQSLASSPYFITWDLISCAKLRGKKPENIEKEVLKSLTNLEIKQPSLLVLDDLDVLISPTKVEEQNSQEFFLHYKINETLLELIMKYKSSRLAIVCTAISKDSMTSYWKSRPGFHFFQKFMKINPPSKSERLEIFTACLQRYLKGPGSEGLSCVRPTLAGKAAPNAEALLNLENQNNDNKNEGRTHPTASVSEKGAICGLENDELTKQIAVSLGAVHEQNATPQFLINMSKKWGAYLQSLEQNVAAGVGHVSPSVASGINNIIGNEDVIEKMKAFNEILEEEIRFSGDLDALKKSRHTNKISWDSLGGLTNIKQEIKKILQWPIKFPQFFRNSPVRLPAGVLFYGYPGTGKSLMGHAIQSIVNVKFIHVKGPELLSKYIGASEQAVQDVFTRARDSRPCILFFDEFDSLVPRRGHDSSGVTDRVVNQFLSEMDGVDGGLGEGVYLIAATSRPDLIDPAVLRPGRLDKHLFFDLPTETERKGILKAISSQVSLKLKDESEWDEISRLTEGFTGADLNSLVFSAQLAVVQEYLGKLNNSSDKLKGQSSSPVPVDAAVSCTSTQEMQVTRESLLLSLKDFKPSLQGQEGRKFQAIFDGFTFSRSSGATEVSVGTKLEEGVSQPWRMEAGKRATLA